MRWIDPSPPYEAAPLAVVLLGLTFSQTSAARGGWR